MIRRLTEIRDADGALAHQMCCICFDMTPATDLWRDQSGQAWDLCSNECAAKAGA